MVTIDLETLQGWNDLPDGTYDITVAAKAEGYVREKQSLPVSVVKETPGEEYFLTFSSPDSFTLNVADNTQQWDGTLEYSTDKENWNEWDGTTVLNSGSNNELYLRGIGNTIITVVNWDLNGTDISCTGNIENLLDYQTVLNGQHPTMGDLCYGSMFAGCTSLTQAPVLPATTLSERCYESMFYGCTSLTTAPKLPATTLASGCYVAMFAGCTSLTTAPELPATTLVEGCYGFMFQDCTSLIQAPELPATTLTDYCYANMFDNCTSLTTAPELPATTLAEGCYNSMFNNCESLTAVPELPATTLEIGCYDSMFQGCTSLTTAPVLPATTLAESCYGFMFQGCTSLYVSDTQTAEAQYEWRIPANGVVTGIDNYEQSDMFTDCSGTRASDSLSGVVGQQYIYYTQNPLVGSN